MSWVGDREKPIHLTRHVRTVIAERDLDYAWVEQTVRHPEWALPDPHDPTVQRLYRSIEERGGRVLRVAAVETESEVRILTAFLDRKARRPT